MRLHRQPDLRLMDYALPFGTSTHRRIVPCLIGLYPPSRRPRNALLVYHSSTILPDAHTKDALSFVHGRPNTRPCPSEVSGERLWPELPEGEISFAVCGDRKCNSFLVNKYWIRHLFVTSFSYGPRRIFIALPPSILSLCCWSPSSDSLLL